MLLTALPVTAQGTISGAESGAAPGIAFSWREGREAFEKARGHVTCGCPGVCEHHRMTLERKIIASFLIIAVLVAALALAGAFTFVDIRLAMIILAGSFFGIQLGAIGTTCVKPYMIKIVMGSIMAIVLFSRALMVPVCAAQLKLIPAIDPETVKLLKRTSLAIMAFALLLGAGIVLKAIWRGRRAEKPQTAGAPVAVTGKL